MAGHRKRERRAALYRLQRLLIALKQAAQVAIGRDQ